MFPVLSSVSPDFSSWFFLFLFPLRPALPSLARLRFVRARSLALWARSLTALAEPDSRSILVQPSTSLPLPLPLHSRCGGPDSSRESGWKTVWRTTAILAAVGLGIWHVWSVLGEFDLDLEA